MSYLIDSAAGPRAQQMRRLILSLFFLTASAAAQTPVSGDQSARIGQIVGDAMKSQQIPAMTVAVGSGNKIIYTNAFGTADVENGLPATVETLIRTGSIAKPITAAAAMTLVEAGKLDLDAPIQKYCAAFPVKKWPITSRQLLSHTSGIRHYKEGEIESTHHFSSMADGFAIFAADPLLFEPGTAFSYSTYGYTVLGCVIEGASGQKFEDYVAEHILNPAGMAHTFVDDVLRIIPHRAHGYQKINGQVRNAGLMDSSYKIPGGGYTTTAEDLVRFAQAMMDGKIMKREMVEQMWTPAKVTGPGKQSTYGLGFGVLMLEGGKYIAHSGGQQGTSTMLVIIPEKRFAVAALANMDGVNPGEVVRAILALFNMPTPKPETR